MDGGPSEKLLGIDPDDQQMELFPERNQAREVLLSLWEHRDKIDRLHKLMTKVLAGEPGYARDPKPVLTPPRSRTQKKV